MRNHSSPGFGSANPADGVWQFMDQLRARFESFEKVKGAGGRASRGDVRAAVLALLIEKPMHGYQIIREIEQRTGGTWKPSAGSVYPTLQLLADEGLVEPDESNGRKSYALTEAGREVAREASESAPWASADAGEAGEPGDGRRAFSALPKAGAELAHAVGQIGRSGTPEQVARAVTVLDEARRRIYSILAED